MTIKRSILWILCAVVSVLAHVTVLFALGYVVRPDAPTPQEMPQTRLEIQARDVKRTKATEESAETEQAAQGQANSAAVSEATIPQTHAESATPTAMPVAELTIKSQLTATTSAPPQASIQAAALAADIAKTPATPLRADKLPIAFLDTDSGREVMALPTPLPEANSSELTGNAHQLALPAEQGTAMLAWSGAGNETVDPVSLAAIQAFMQPGDLDQTNSDAGRVRDGIETLLTSIPCARLQTTFIPDTGSLELRGHIPNDAMRPQVLAALEAQIGAAIPVSDNLLILPRPQCGALSGIADIGLPQSTEQLTNSRVVGPNGFARNFTYTAGERLSLELTAPDYDGVVYVDFFSADGNVFHLQPNEIVGLEIYPAKSQFTVGKDIGDKPALDITISPPFGQEIAVAFATSAPLYDGLRPLVEPAEPYLEFLKTRVAAARSEQPNFKGEWVYFFVSTKAN